MSKLVGVVEEVKNYTDPTKGWTKTSTMIQSVWYSGFQDKKKNANEDPMKQVKPGDTVELEYEQNGKYFNIKTLAIKTVAPPPAPEKESATGNAYLDLKDFNQSKGNAAKLAVAFVMEAIKLEILPVPATKNKKAEAALAHVDHYTREFTKMLLSITPDSLEDTVEAPEENEGNE
jgi:ribosomal 50S subunit-recycling heat shock protein